MKFALHKLFCLFKINGYIRSYSVPKHNKYLYIRHYYYDLQYCFYTYNFKKINNITVVIF